ncbi:hypothetical protein GPJ56_009866 [Histomonas meleagridis]|uniref:uncharacterized protein n=1 Tax=Histomonas meleagridis TaxID=135588 RepID=UPI00355A8E4F|nr:hypothetical protein GPJ56_009866 [Histomonas meleagridis]KAH0802827.1 hypothetical protein GO595_004334 [Histomonas meleagridis]
MVLDCYTETQKYVKDCSLAYNLEIAFFPVEAFFALLTLTVYNCRQCGRCGKCSLKVLTWITAVSSLGTIFNYVFAFYSTNPSKCAIFLDFTKQLREKAVNSCLKPHSKIAGFLVYFVITHVLMLLYMMMINYGVYENPMRNQYEQMDDEASMASFNM